MVGYFEGYIKEFILGLNQEKCFETVFKDGIPNKRTVSPFRPDRNPGCFFKEFNGILYFVDFAEEKSHLNCIEFLAKKENKSIEEIIRDLVGSKNFSTSIQRQVITKDNIPTKIFIVKRAWSMKDKIFWSEYGITKKQLIDDNVIPLRRFTITKGNKSKTIYPNDISYGYIVGDRIKIYSPYSSHKFITNCHNGSIGGSKITQGDLLVITKAYKDYRVIKNSGIEHVIWFQNERILPSIDFVTDIGKRYKNVIIFYDNDETGIRGSKIIASIFNKYYPNKAFALYLPTNFSYKDPSDFVKNNVKEGQEVIYKLIKNSIRRNNYEN